MAHIIDSEKCVGCGVCKDNCPVAAIEDDAANAGKMTIDAEKCVDCGACAGNCPCEAISQA